MASTEYVIGRNACRLVLEQRPGQVRRVFCMEASGQADKNVTAVIEGLAQNASLAIERLDKKALTELVGSPSHQGFAVQLKGRHTLELKTLLTKVQEKERSLVLALDSIQDPHNVGAILRAAECFAVDAVLWSRNRSASITPAVSKVSVGASEIVPLVTVSNLAQALKKLKAAGYWTVVAHCHDRATTLANLEWPDKTVLIMGGESQGAKNRTIKESDFSVYIPMQGLIDSLNVSQAAAVLLYAASMRDS